MMRPGLLVTFYSYKGGVGRSFLLANVAALLATWGYKVLCVDWDLEAPGLHRFFERFLKERTVSRGLLELIVAIRDEGGADWRKHLSKVELPNGAGVATLDLLAAGQMGREYAEVLRGISWRGLFDSVDFGNILEAWRGQWREAYDFVLIDSRTGITDIRGICTVHLPDLLVLVFCANRQNIEGVIEAGARAVELRNELPFDRPGLIVLPVPSRFELNEHKLAEEWQATFARELAPFYEPWLDATRSPADMLALTKVPYFTYWSFGEKLAVVEEPRHTAGTVSYFLTTIAALIARRAEESDAFVTSRDDYVAMARLSAPSEDGDGMFDLYVSYSSADVAYAARLITALRKIGLTVRDGRETPDPAEGAGGRLVRDVRSARHVAVLLGPTLDSRLEAALTNALQRMVAELLSEKQDPGRVVFIRRDGAALGRLLGQFPHCPQVEAGGRSEFQVAEEIAASIGYYLRHAAERDELYL